GTMGEDVAIDSMLNGATDYVLKHKLERLVPAINRAMHEYELEIMHKHAELKLKESEILFKTIFNDAPMGIALIDSLSGKILNINPMFAKIAGQTMAEMINIDWMSITHPDDIQLDKNKMAQVVKGKINGFKIEKRYIHPNKSSIWINMTVSSLLDKDKLQPQHLCMIEDITLRKQTEQELIIANKELGYQNQEKEKQAAELYIANRDLAFENKEKEIRAAELIIINNKLAFKNQEKEFRTAELNIANRELRFQNEEKEKRAAELIIANKELSFQNEEKEKRTAELVVANAEIIAQNKKLHNQNKELEQFTYIASHDLQEPLHTLISFTELIKVEQNGKIDKQTDKYLNFIAKSTERMQELVKGLLDYAQIGKASALTLVDCNQIINDVMDDLTVSINESNAKITVKELPKLNGYETELRQLFQNLISNAIKFRKKEENLEIKVSAKKDTANWTFSIQDNGIGIDEKNQDKVFTIFKRLHNRNEYEGLGIGLAHCKKIVELHNGSIWIDSKLGDGSIFNFTIPKI
ncbi:MAG: ATP-binding protein, partial [Flavobacteriaceae bacterium]|nr:ATP-binding protein [Flavobacteriaceae bacterium]